MTAACCCPWEANCVVELRLATVIGGSFIKLCGPVLVAFQLSDDTVGVVGVGTVGIVPTVPFVGGNSGDVTKGYPPLPNRDGSMWKRNFRTKL